MFDTVLTSAGAFFRGKLFRDNGTAFSLLGLGVLVTVGVFYAAGRFGGLPIYASAAIAGFVGGALQPRLYKNLKYL